MIKKLFDKRCVESDQINTDEVLLTLPDFEIVGKYESFGKLSETNILCPTMIETQYL